MAKNDSSAIEPLCDDPPGVSTETPQLALPVLRRAQEPCVLIIFGASGDLTGRKLIPGLYNLACQELLPERFSVVGYAITPLDSQGFRERMRERVKQSPDVLAFRDRLWDEFAPALHYLSGDFEDSEGFRQLATCLAELDAKHGSKGNHLFYLATPPSCYSSIVQNLAGHGLVRRVGDAGGWTRVIVEKPFGRDLESARRLNAVMHQVFEEDQIYRIDHYLGKETVQNILAFRFANSIIEPIWNRNYFDHVQITAAETLGVEHRGGYYEEAGCLRDMFQNHLLQLLALIAMEPPVRYDRQSVRDRKMDVLRAIIPTSPQQLDQIAVRGQYGPGQVEGVAVPAYRSEPAVAPDSGTETFAALKLMMDNWRWAGVPFYLRSGKRLARKLTVVSIEFKRVPHLFFPHTAHDQIEPNALTIRVQPDEGISLKLGAKAPGPEMHIRQMQMDFSYADAFGDFPATAYETLLLDALQGDPTLFNRNDAVELSWHILQPILETWQASRAAAPFPNYVAGGWGPAAADALLAHDGRKWRNTTAVPRFYLTEPNK
ncbi:MAG: glucose-6-phosphate dehydrogenase [Deltaproteobacteria bacterium]|nr:glucose-6-phosphate dehydrogenase [Deltaproteobacteria bacterium]